MRKLVWVVVVFLVAVSSIGALFYQPKANTELSDRSALVSLVLDDVVTWRQPNQTKTRDNVLIVLWTPSLNRVEVPKSVQGFSIQVLTQVEIDALAAVKPVNYIIFTRVIRMDSKSAEV